MINCHQRVIEWNQTGTDWQKGFIDWDEESPEDLLVSLLAAVTGPANLRDNHNGDNDNNDDDHNGDVKDDYDVEHGGEDDDGNLAKALAQGTGAMTWALAVLHSA